MEVKDIERARGMILDFVGSDRVLSTLSFMDEELYSLAGEWLDVHRTHEQKTRIEQQTSNNNASHVHKM